MRICFFGDSFVAGVGDRSCLGWVGRIWAAARAAGHDITCYSLGIRGDGSGEIAQRWQEEAARRLPPAFPSRLVFAFGTNDSIVEDDKPRVPLDRTVKNARSLLRAAKQSHPTLMIGPPPIADTRSEEPMAALSRALASLCLELDVAYLDLHTALAAMPQWRQDLTAGDGVHPSATGYELIAGLVEGWEPWRGWLAGRI